MAQTGQSEAIHSPEAWARTVVRLMIPAGLVDGSGLNRCNLMLAQDLPHNVESAR
jgi:hypothetical protein